MLRFKVNTVLHNLELKSYLNARFAATDDTLKFPRFLTENTFLHEVYVLEKIYMPVFYGFPEFNSIDFARIHGSARHFP